MSRHRLRHPADRQTDHLSDDRAGRADHANAAGSRWSRCNTSACTWTALWETIKDRVAGLKSGTISPDQMMVPGARAMLEALCARGVRCYLASGHG